MLPFTEFEHHSNVLLKMTLAFHKVAQKQVTGEMNKFYPSDVEFRLPMQEGY